MRFLFRWLPVILWACLILSAANDHFSDRHTEGWLERVFGDIPPEINVIFRKTGHVTEYAILALLGWHARKTIPAPFLIALGVSIADETMQAMTVTRTGSPADVALDMLGASIALLALPGMRARISSLVQRS